MTAVPWVSVDELANHVGVGKNWWYRWIEARDFLPREVRQLRQPKLSDIDEWVRRRGANPGTEHDSGEGDRA